jgi:hypothetical protein
VRPEIEAGDEMQSFTWQIADTESPTSQNSALFANDLDNPGNAVFIINEMLICSARP